MTDENKSINISEKKRTGLIVLIIALLLCLLAVFAWWLFPKAREVGTSGIYTKEALEEKTLKVITLLDQDDFDSLQADATEEMRSVLTKAQIDQVRDQFGDNWGERLSFGTVYMQETVQQGWLYATTQVVVTYENMTITYVISFDQEMRLAGIYIKE